MSMYSFDNELSIKPDMDFRMMPTPVHTIFKATRIAMTGSNTCHPEIATAPTPIRTPPDVQTSVMRWCEFDVNEIELYCFPARRRIKATPKFAKDAMIETIIPIPTCSRGSGGISRWVAAYAILIAATNIKAPSTPLEKYSALLCPKV